ncbi:MaoC/PaaZ C-terminal domain-containing protein [Nocardioides zeae]|uniref:MaoC/PaaZ C-terminal domain-containing protein n=1 Tax=Nocardioides imazamoxiresistens TaxID=3231893 RepID=A0ABU3PTG7_9ACTN|nr:MaoC/PaaZ C-terminal domain-containing protein [Nocardioides zeae]MDT9592489.1 MaoC/PaaZ C-terminal domain-containing protein [Nocardioides zeae]
MTETKTLTGPAGGLGVLARAALPAVPVLNQLPGVRKSGGSFAGLAFERPPVRIERDEVDAYAAVCGFPRKDTVPVTYPHMLAFGLHMAIMSDPAFPYPAIGTVHLENQVTSHRPVRVGETLALRTEAGPARPHPKGRVLDFVTTARAGDEVVWESVSTYLRRGRGDEDAPFGSTFEEVPATGTRWRLPGDLGRRYAAVSGDHNPIHLYPWTAKALGFPRQIAHGMWTKARCVAQLENRLPDAVRIEVSFRKPVLLPGTVAFGSRPAPQGYAFSLTDPRRGSVHLLGRTTALD